MPRIADGGRRVSESLGCEIAGLTPPKRRAWVKRGVLPESDVKRGLTELQVVELAIVQLLHDFLGPSDAHIVWQEVGDDVRQSLLGDRLDLVIDAARRECRLIRTDADLAGAVATGRLVRVIALAPVIAKTREAFRRVAGVSQLTRQRRARGHGASSGSA